MDIKEIVAQNLKHRRLELGYSQEKLAYLSGTCSATISQMENSKRNCSLDLLTDIAMALDMEVGDLTVPLKE